MTANRENATRRSRRALRIVALTAALGGSALGVAGCKSCCPFASPGPSHTTGTVEPDTWIPLFDGKSLDGWRQSDFLNAGVARAEDGKLILPVGEVLTGVTYTKDFPKVGYEIRLEAMRLSGGDFFCGLTFPYHESCASLIIGGWGGTLCGISSLDGEDAANNSTTTIATFENDVWYEIRLRVTDGLFEAWLDGKKIVDISTKDRQVDVRVEVEASKPLGLATFQTTAAIRGLRWRKTP